VPGGRGGYNALQITLQKHYTHGVQFDLNYTYSHSFDISSDSYRINDEGGLGGQVINPWSPNALRASSDFDLRHQINANWIAELPFGKGKWIGGDVNRLTDAFIGGWQLSGLARWTSGFPIGPSNGAQWPTNWELSGYATQVDQVSTHGAVKNSAGNVNLFGDPAAVTKAFAAFQPDFPGRWETAQSARRRICRLTWAVQRWKMPEKNPNPCSSWGCLQCTQPDAIRRAIICSRTTAAWGLRAC
jgi:hypothetical protein